MYAIFTTLADLLPAAHSLERFQQQLGEFSGMLALANCIEAPDSGCATVYPNNSWIGFTR